MPEEAAISGLDDASQARVRLLQSGRAVHAPILGIGLQQLDPTLTAIAGLTGAADRGIYFTGADVAALFTFTAFARTLLDDADAIAARATLGVSYELIETASLSAVASYAKTGLSAFRKLRASGYFLPANDGVNLYGQSDANGGASYDGGVSDYTYQTMRATGASTLTGLSANDIGLIFNPGVTIGNAAGEGIDFTIEINEFNQARQMRARFTMGWLDTAGARVSAFGTGQRNDTNARDAIRLIFSAGNIATGNITLEGIRG